MGGNLYYPIIFLASDNVLEFRTSIDHVHYSFSSLTQMNALKEQKGWELGCSNFTSSIEPPNHKRRYIRVQCRQKRKPFEGYVFVWPIIKILS